MIYSCYNFHQNPIKDKNYLIADGESYFLLNDIVAKKYPNCEDVIKPSSVGRYFEQMNREFQRRQLKYIFERALRDS